MRRKLWPLLACLLCLFLPRANAQNFFQMPNFEERPLQLSNRAQCAVESKRPGQSAFLMLSNMEAAKSVYRLAKFRREDTDQLTKMGIDKFRYTVLQLVGLIHRRLMTSQLPLLPVDVEDKSSASIPEYGKIMSDCANGEDCPALNQYL